MDGDRPRRAGPKGPGSKGPGADTPRPPRAPSAKRIVLASIGSDVPDEVIDRVSDVAADLRGEGADAPVPVVHVLAIARIWGTSLGIPHPGLYPNRHEIDEQRRIVDAATVAVARRGFQVKGRILSTRNAAKVIGRFAESIGASAIVVGDPSGAMKGWERTVKGSPVKELVRVTRIPVYAVPIDDPAPQGSRTARDRK
jgi:Universal stress protein family